MKNHSTSSPRFVCRMVRASLAAFGGEQASAKSTHVAGCPDCQQFYGAVDELDSLLRRDAHSRRATPSAGLEASILAAVRQSARPAPRPARRLSLPLLSLAGAAAAAAIAFVLLQDPVATPPASDPSAHHDAETIRLAQDFIGSLPDRLLAEVQPRAEEILQTQDPLRNEAVAVAANAQTALRYVAANFLPSDSELLRRRSG